MTWALGRLGPVGNGVQPRAVNRERRVAVGRLDPRAHLLERRRSRGASAGATARRRRSIVARKRAGPPGRRPAAASSCPSCRRRAASAGERSRPKPRPIKVTVPSGPSSTSTPSRPQAGQRRPAVGSRRKIGQRRASLGERGEQGVAVRDRLVARHAEAARARGGRARSWRRAPAACPSDLTRPCGLDLAS